MVLFVFGVILCGLVGCGANFKKRPSDCYSRLTLMRPALLPTSSAVALPLDLFREYQTVPS